MILNKINPSGFVIVEINMDFIFDRLELNELFIITAIV